MPLNMKLNAPVDKIIKDSGINVAAVLFAAAEARKLMHDYVPMKTGALADTAQVFVENDRGAVFYTQPYAGSCYYGENKNFSRDRNEKATAYWDKAMLLSNKGVLTARVGDYIKNKNGGGLIFEMGRNKKKKTVNISVNKEEKIIEWAGKNPYLTDMLKINWLAEHNGSCSIAPVPGEAFVEKYIDGSSLKRYDFMFQVMFALSETTDNVNIENMFALRQWQNWIDEMERTGDYPDFGESCCDYELQNLANSPQLAQIYDNGMAKYQFPARLIYTEI